MTSDDEWIRSQHGDGDEHTADKPQNPSTAGGLRQPEPDPDPQPDQVQPDPPPTGHPGAGLEQGQPRDVVGNVFPGQPGPGQLSLFQASVGPLPEADKLEQYREVDPSFPERIVRMAEASTTDMSRRADRALDAQISEQRTGQRSAIALAFLGVIAAIVFGALGHYAIAGVFISVPFVLLVRALLGDTGRFFGHGGNDPEED